MTTRQITSAIKAYIKDKGYKNMMVKSIRGTFHIDNTDMYWMTAKGVAESATGYQFVHYGQSMTAPRTFGGLMLKIEKSI